MDLHALVIGIATYQHINPLPPSVLQDARDIHALLVDPQRCGYQPANVQLLLDGQATQAARRWAAWPCAATRTRPSFSTSPAMAAASKPAPTRANICCLWT
jgi:hypothetical protein